MKILAVFNALHYGGAELSTISCLKLIKDLANVKVVCCEGAKENFLLELETMKIPVFLVPYKIVFGFQVMDLSVVKDVLDWAEIVWLSDGEYLTAPLIKKLKKIPIVAHLRSYALICPWWSASFGLKEVCSKKCSCYRLVRCKQLVNDYLAEWGYLSKSKANLYKVADLGKGPLDYLRFPMNKEVISAIDGLVAISHDIREIHINHLPALKDKPFAVIYNPIVVPEDLLRYSLSLDNNLVSNKITYASGINPTKGLHILLAATSMLSEKVGSIEVLIADDYTPETSELMKIVKVKFGNFKAKITFVGKKNYREILTLYAESRVVVMPSVWPEPFGRVAAEANMLGVPVIASKIGGLPEIVDEGTTGYLTKPNDPKDMSEKITEVFNHRFDRVSIHHSTSSKFNGLATAENFIKFLNQFMKNGDE